MKRVLIIDDSEIVRQQVQSALGTAGFEVLEAADGGEGLTKIREEPSLAVVLCDVHMPVKTGLDVLEQVRNEGGLSAVPIIMLTTDADPQLMQRARSAGASAWIVKPFKPNLLVSAVQKLAGA